MAKILFEFGASEGEEICWKNPYVFAMTVGDNWPDKFRIYLHLLWFRCFIGTNMMHDNGNFRPKKKLVWLTINFFFWRFLEITIGVPFWRTMWPAGTN